MNTTDLDPKSSQVWLVGGGIVSANFWQMWRTTFAFQNWHSAIELKRYFLRFIQEFSRIHTLAFMESGWLMSIVVPHEPHFLDMPADTYTLWGYGLFIDDKGNYIQKPMAQCTGREILTELIHQLGFDDILDAVMKTTDVTTVMMPYASALFSRRVPHDRPLVIPTGSHNFAFLGQFVELPEDTVFTVEYSVHCALHAAFAVDKAIPPMYHGLMDPKVGWKALESAFR